jgi:hypothetical protein
MDGTHTSTNGQPPRELFREVQPLHQNLLIRVLVPLETVVMLAIVVPIMLIQPSPTPWAGLGIVLALAIGLPLIFAMVRLRTTVTDRELIVDYRPFPGRRIPIRDIRSAEAVRYNPLASGGWGWRISATHHRVFNVSGDRGVHVVYGESKHDQFLVGSRRAEELAEAIELARFAASEDGNASIAAQPTI